MFSHGANIIKKRLLGRTVRTKVITTSKKCTCVQDQLLQLMDGLPKLFNSTKGLSAAIYTQISDVEAEVNGELTPFMQELL